MTTGFFQSTTNQKHFVGEQESRYIATKSAKSIPAWRSYLSRAELTDFEIDSFIPSQGIPGVTLPNIGLAISGGGIRALLGCAGVLNAFDDRNEQANQAGTGGILQLANYITGLSGFVLLIWLRGVEHAKIELMRRRGCVDEWSALE